MTVVDFDGGYFTPHFQKGFWRASPHVELSLSVVGTQSSHLGSLDS